MSDKLKFCPMLTGKKEIKAVCIGDGDYVVPTFQTCIQEHCTAYVTNGAGEKWCNHYHAPVELPAEMEE